MLMARVDVGLPFPVPNLVAAAYDGDQYGPASHDDLGVALPPSLSGAVSRRKAAYLAGRYCAMQSLSQAGHPLPCDLPIGEDRSPVWPDGLVGSITHTDGLAAAVVASARDARGLGIDAESVIGVETCRLLRDQVVCDGEWRFGGDGSSWSDRLFFTMIFSAKESIFKCLYPQVGKYFDFLDVEIVAWDAESRAFRFRVLTDLSDRVSAGFEADGCYSILPGMVFTYVGWPCRPRQEKGRIGC
ncbi:4'-phosphopantetheinyl transferase family protein [Chromobacterium sp. CV08]|uniref:4'-phosphopantetheinyl transferase family protein n=1 Tax=Chromobacterium sp. CV08 TaxID=3133274 RepID=UPI003DA96E86